MMKWKLVKRWNWMKIWWWNLLIQNPLLQEQVRIFVSRVKMLDRLCCRRDSELGWERWSSRDCESICSWASNTNCLTNWNQTTFFQPPSNIGTNSSNEENEAKIAEDESENQITRRMDGIGSPSTPFVPSIFTRRRTQTSRPTQLVQNRRMMMVPVYTYPSEPKNCLINPQATHVLFTKLVSSPGGFGTKILLKECKGNIARMRAIHKARQGMMLRAQEMNQYSPY